MFYLIFWQKEKTISVVEEKEIEKFQGLNNAKVMWQNAIFQGKILAKNGEKYSNLNQLKIKCYN